MIYNPCRSDLLVYRGISWLVWDLDYMSIIKIGDKVPDFTFQCTDPSIHSFKDLLGKNIVLYFYPKDNTPGCTIEGREFKSFHSFFQQANTIVIGVSRDSLESHHRFCEKLGLPFPLIADKDKKLCEIFDVMIKDNWLMSKLIVTHRSTFLIDTQGIIKHCWPNVRAKGHAQTVLNYINSMNSN